MENNEVLNRAEYLRELLSKHELVMKVKDSENQMLNDDEVSKLSSDYLTAQTQLEDAIRYNLDLSKYKQELSYRKTLLYTHPKVEIYLKNFKEANEFLKEVQESVFDGLVIDFKDVTCIKK